MDTILLFILIAFVVAILLNGMQPPEQTMVMYVPIEAPRARGEGCLPFLLLLVAIILGLMFVAR